MKIKVINKTYSEVMALPVPKHEKPKRIGIFFRTLIKVLSATNLKGNHISYNEHQMERLGKKEPCLILMNHSSFIDMQIAANYLYPRPFSTVCTTDAYMGKAWLMRQIGCIPTQKFVADLTLIKDISYALKELKSSVLMYPEAIYSFDGTASALPDTVGRLVKMLKVHVVTIITHGAFSREPLYNMLRHREVDISADVTYLLSPEEIENTSAEDINSMIKEKFSFDSFRWQQENKIVINEDFRADGLERVLYKCPHCLAEGKNVGKGIHIVCGSCGKKYELTELGYLSATDGESAFTHIPDWFAWEREQVKSELRRGEYLLDIDVDIYMLVDSKALYSIGEGHLTHNSDGFRLCGGDGELDYSQSPLSSYSLNADYFWYEIGDVISIGNKRHLFYCFPKKAEDAIVAKAKIAAEELYKIKKEDSKRSK
ncbi:MAG: 1-acyl-sn-glycerol-3-phosphate acyltransferase [Clostridia bacterium]|nr:1-acyl-sn-glycerol-3-phosphate acyltransferase [Clostridia bacterium]